jgi:hypothetical protein
MKIPSRSPVEGHRRVQEIYAVLSSQGAKEGQKILKIGYRHDGSEGVKIQKLFTFGRKCGKLYGRSRPKPRKKDDKELRHGKENLPGNHYI